MQYYNVCVYFRNAVRIQLVVIVIVYCHRMSDFNLKMHQIRFPLGLCPDHTGHVRETELAIFVSFRVS